MLRKKRGAKEIIDLITKHQAGKKIAKFAETNFEHEKWRPPNPGIPGDPGGRGFQELARQNIDNPIYEKFEKGGTRSRKIKKSRRTKKPRRTKRKLRKRKTRRKSC
jgi:hypothetical protein